MNAARALIDHNRQLLQVIQASSENDALPSLMETRSQRLLAFGAALEHGEKVSPEEVQELKQLECELFDRVLHRRDAVAQELAALHRRRGAERMYQQQTRRGPQYVDRAG
jgi:hypothetical protein